MATMTVLDSTSTPQTVFKPTPGSATSANSLPVVIASDQAATTAGVAPIVSSASETNHVFKAAPGVLFDVYVFPSQQVFLLGFDSTTVPADGAVTPKWIAGAAPNISSGFSYTGLPPAAFVTGCCFCVSTTGPFTKTTPGSGTYFFSARVI